MCGHQCWHSGGRDTDHTDEVRKIQLIVISSIPPLFILEIASSKHRAVWNGHASPWIDLWDDHSVLKQMPRNFLVFPMLGTPTIIALPQWDKRLCSTSYLRTWVEPTGKELALAIIPSLKVLSCLAYVIWETLDTKDKTLYKCINTG